MAFTSFLPSGAFPWIKFSSCGGRRWQRAKPRKAAAASQTHTQSSGNRTSRRNPTTTATAILLQLFFAKFRADVLCLCRRCRSSSSSIAATVEVSSSSSSSSSSPFSAMMSLSASLSLSFAQSCSSVGGSKVRLSSCGRAGGERAGEGARVDLSADGRGRSGGGGGPEDREGHVRLQDSSMRKIE